MIETLDIATRAAAAGIGILLITHFLSMRPISRKTASALALVISSIGLIVVTSLVSKEVAQQSATWTFFTQFVMALHAPLIAWGLLELFDDDFEVQWWQAGFVGISIPTHFMAGIHPIFGTICHLSSITIYAYIFYVAIATRKHDLVEARCMFRLWFMSSAGLAGLTFSSLSLIFGDYGLGLSYYLLKASVMLVLFIIFSYWALKVREYVWALPNREKKTAPENLSPAETSLLAKLQTSMEEDIWRQEGLTIRKLADALSAPEHRLRKVINHGMGYRNFAHFVNEHRIGAACEVLADPIKADVPIISVAYEVGYASLGPFNRAFRDIVGESPTEYRKRSFAHA